MSHVNCEIKKVCVSLIFMKHRNLGFFMFKKTYILDELPLF